MLRWASAASLGGDSLLTARRRSKKPPRKPSGKRGQSAPRSRVPEAEEVNERDILETHEQLEERLASDEREVARWAPQFVDAVLPKVLANRRGDDALHIRLQKRESRHIAQAVRQFADPFFERLFADANDASREFVRRIKQSDALRDLIGNNQLSLEQLGLLLQTLTLQYVMGREFESSLSQKPAGKFSTLSIPALKKRRETLRAAAQYLFDDSHSGVFAGGLRDRELAFQLAELVFRYSLALEYKQQLSRRLSGQPRKRGRPKTPFGRFAEIAYQILAPLPDRKRLDLIVPFSGEFFGKTTNLRQLRDLLTRAGVR